MYNKPRFIKLIQVWGLIILIAMGGSVVALDIVSSYLEFNSRAEQMRTEYVIQQKQEVKREVDRVVARTNYKKAQSEALRKKSLGELGELISIKALVDNSFEKIVNLNDNSMFS